MNGKPSLFSELRRRNVFRVALTYAVVAWLLIEIAAVFLPMLGAPEWMIFSGPLTLDAESVSFVRPPLTTEAPAGEHHVELTLEVSNLHTAPGHSLVVKLPLTVRIGA